jgi:hypothetical protein
MKIKPRLLFLPLVFSAPAAQAVLVSLNTITPGTEVVALVANGGFELGSGNTNPTNWTRGGGARFDTPANAGLTAYSNLPTVGKVAYYNSVVGTNAGGNFSQTISGLDPDTEYVFSAYLWNNSVAAFGASRNLVMDMADIPNEAQLVFAGNTENAAQGYFAYVTFNTANTGTTIPIRIFPQPTTYSTAGLQMVAWDNVAITRAVDFAAPVPEPSAALLGGLGLLALLRRDRGRVEGLHPAACR